MELSTIISIVAVIVTFVCGLIAKKVSWFNNKLIPIQNLAIGIIAGVIYYCITKDLNLTIMAVGLGTGGAYDIVHNINKLLEKGEE
jgi:hypothetical protein